jgi:hypothetical protein
MTMLGSLKMKRAQENKENPFKDCRGTKFC